MSHKVTAVKGIKFCLKSGLKSGRKQFQGPSRGKENTQNMKENVSISKLSVLCKESSLYFGTLTLLGVWVNCPWQQITAFSHVGMVKTNC